MVKSRDSTSNGSACSSCIMYRTRIKELEELNDMHRRLNGELQESLSVLLDRVHSLSVMFKHNNNG